MIKVIGVFNEYKYLIVNYFFHIIFTSGTLFGLKQFGDKELLFEYINLITNYQVIFNVLIFAIPGYILIKKNDYIDTGNLNNTLIISVTFPVFLILLILDFLGFLNIGYLHIALFTGMSILHLHNVNLQVGERYLTSLVYFLVGGLSFYILPIYLYTQTGSLNLIYPFFIILTLNLLHFSRNYKFTINKNVLKDFFLFSVPATLISFVYSYFINLDRLLILKTDNVDMMDNHFPYMLLGLVFLAIINMLSFIWGFMSVNLIKKDFNMLAKYEKGVILVSFLMFSTATALYYMLGEFYDKFYMDLKNNYIYLLYFATLISITYRSVYNTYVNYYRKQYLSVIVYLTLFGTLYFVLNFSSVNFNSLKSIILIYGICNIVSALAIYLIGLNTRKNVQI